MTEWTTFLSSVADMPDVAVSTLPVLADYLRTAYEEASNSPDPSTQNGALLVDHRGHIVSRDHNRFPKGVEYKPERWERPLKYKIIEHAERNTIYRQGRQNIPWHRPFDGVVQSTADLVMVCPWAACSDCARGIIEAGIKVLVTHKQAHDRSPDFWKQEIEVAFQMFKEAGVKVVFFDGTVSGPEVLHSGQKWKP